MSLRWYWEPGTGAVLGYHYPQLGTTLNIRVRSPRDRETVFLDLQAME